MVKNKKNQLFEHQVLVTGILVCAVVISMIGGSYAWFNSQAMNDEYNAFQESDFELSYVDDNNGYGEVLSLVNTLPVSDQEGMDLKPYRFSVTNVGDEEKYFSLKINLDQAIIEQDNCMGKILSTSYIKYKIDNQEPKILSNVEQGDYEIYVSPETIMPGSSEIHELRIWIDQDSPKIVDNKHFHAKVTVEDKDQNKKYDVYTVGQAVTLLDGSKYHVLQTSKSTDSKVKLISDYHIDFTGVQDTKCVISEFIQKKISPEDYELYCSTMSYQDAVNVLYGEYLNKLQSDLKEYDTRIDNLEVRFPEKRELEVLSFSENQVFKKDNIVTYNWLVNSNFWTMTNQENDINYNWCLSSDKEEVALKQYSNNSKYFGLRPVIIIDKDNIKK